MTFLRPPARLFRAVAKRLLRLGGHVVQLGVGALIVGAILLILDALLLGDLKRPA